MNASENNEDFFLNMIIQKLLDYKFLQITWFRHFMFFHYVVFLFCLMIFPILNLNDEWMILVWTFLEVIRETIQLVAILKQGGTVLDYFSGIWNYLDWI